MCINCDSLRSVDKRAELNCLVNHHNPHIILGQESRLGPDIPSCEIFHKGSINQSIKFISNQIKKFDIQCTLYNIHGKLFYNKHVATFSISD